MMKTKVKTPRAKPKNCVKGFACRNSCISPKLKCKYKPSATAITKIDNLVGAINESTQTKPEATKKPPATPPKPARISKDISGRPLVSAIAKDLRGQGYKKDILAKGDRLYLHGRDGIIDVDGRKIEYYRVPPYIRGWVKEAMGVEA